MATDKLKQNQLAILKDKNVANGNTPTIKFTQTGANIKMSIEVTFTPDQFNSNAGDVDITVGDCGVFDTVIDKYNSKVNADIRLKVGPGDVIYFDVASLFTTGEKGDHVQ